MWKLVAALTRLHLAHAYSLVGRVDDALATIGDAMIFGFDLSDYRIIAQTVVAAEPIVTIHGHRDTAEVLLGYLDQFTTMELDHDLQLPVLLAQVNILRMLGQPENASAVCARALDIIRTDQANVPAKLQVKAFTTASLLARDRGNPAQALGHALAVVGLQQQPITAAQLTSLARILNLHAAADAAVTAGRLDITQTLLTQARDLISNNGFDETSIASVDHVTIQARLSAAVGQLDQARGGFEQAIAMLDGMGSGYLPRLPAVLVGLADVLHDQGDLPAAIARVEQALAIDREIYTIDHPETAHERIRLQLWTQEADQGNRTHPTAPTITVVGEHIGRIPLDVVQLLRNIQTGLEQLATDRDARWRVADAASGDDLLAIFYDLAQGPTLIALTLQWIRQYLSANFDADRVTRPIPPSFDLSTVCGEDLGYDKAAQTLATELLNATLAVGAHIESDSPMLLANDPALLHQTWHIVVWMYGLLTAAHHRCL
ncbi:tetratricopeptide repeat protein [Nocardia tengchongensis]|uniref:Tetratricopeptide repeat protein n=1 Tax=Nocardia tengchongensis TaxID=2055889 RepID=A0ABX8CPK1_9NOCA|nr:tetratricopeptide repeat protein [Nocardia tengchongensis]QVI20918.1 tetratricopeptide repeat protein [Nocardia tengchongensis]